MYLVMGDAVEDAKRKYLLPDPRGVMGRFCKVVLEESSHKGMTIVQRLKRLSWPLWICISHVQYGIFATVIKTSD